MRDDIEEIISREKKRAEEFLDKVVKPCYHKMIEWTIKSGFINVEELDEEYTLSRVLFSYLGDRKADLSPTCREMRLNLEYFCSTSNSLSC